MEIKNRDVTRFRKFWFDMNEEERFLFAQRSGVSYSYLKNHLTKYPHTRGPRPGTLDGLVEGSNGVLDKLDVLMHFYPDIVDVVKEAVEKGDDRLDLRPARGTLGSSGAVPGMILDRLPEEQVA